MNKLKWSLSCQESLISDFDWEQLQYFSIVFVT